MSSVSQVCVCVERERETEKKERETEREREREIVAAFILRGSRTNKSFSFVSFAFS